jgi:hypothetical protein
MIGFVENGMSNVEGGRKVVWFCLNIGAVKQQPLKSAMLWASWRTDIDRENNQINNLSRE